jgi:hypothetical protein
MPPGPPVPGGNDDDEGSSVLERIAALHERLKEDVGVRARLDCFLLAVAHDPVNPPAWMVLSYADTFHYWNLPDLCSVLRQTLMGLCPCAHLQRLFNMFLCGKRYRRLVGASDGSVQLSAAVINTLHGLLLGLYPFNERRLELHQRAHVALRVRDAMTARTHAEMIAAYPGLMCLSLVEYVANVADDFLPVELGMIGLIAPVGKSQCLAACEGFREASVAAAVASSSSFWDRLERDAAAVLLTLGKFFRGGQFFQHHPRAGSAAVPEHLPLAMTSRVIQNTASVFGQLKAAYPAMTFPQAEALEEIWTTVFARRLPAHTCLRQMRTLEITSRMCAEREAELHTFPVCLACCMRKVDVMKLAFRHDCVSAELICNECMHARFVVRVNLLGRALYVRDRVVVLCDMCLRPRYWNQPCAAGCAATEFPVCLACCSRKADATRLAFRYDAAELVCDECLLVRRGGDPASSLVLCDTCLRPRKARQPCAFCAAADPVPRCFVCDSRNVFASKRVVDVDAVRMITMSFCYKHTIGCVMSSSTMYDRRGMEREMRGRAFRPTLPAVRGAAGDHR